MKIIEMMNDAGTMQRRRMKPEDATWMLIQSAIVIGSVTRS